MKYLVSFRTTLKLSRYLFRALVFLLWLLVALICVFRILDALQERKANIRQEFNSNFEQAERYIQRTSEMVKELKFITENHIADDGGTLPVNSRDGSKIVVPEFTPLFSESTCSQANTAWRTSLQSLAWILHYWRDNFSSAYVANRLFLIGGEKSCIADFNFRKSPLEDENSIKVLQQRMMKYRNVVQDERSNNIYWLEPGLAPNMGYLYTLTPVYLNNRSQALLGVEQTVQVEDFLLPGSTPVDMMLLNENGRPVITLAGSTIAIEPDSRWMQQRAWFGYSTDFSQLILKRNLAPSSLSIIYSIPIDKVLEPIRGLILSGLLLNVLAGILLFGVARIFEQRIFAPAESDAERLEEHEQFNRKIVASAPVGICILRTHDGTNILSNELAHNYLSRLTHEDRQRLTQIIRGQQVNFVDILASNQTNLQISFVHSRYRNENVAICVLVDVSARVKMEESLQEMAQVSEQASQAKSMFLATVSHELRTPLYGIIGNLDLLQTNTLPKGVARLVTAMSNSSNLLLKIISDILDFSKIESEQLKIEPQEFSPQEVMSHITGNYLPLVVRKQLGLYCFIEPDVPVSLQGDPMRLQQVISNLLSNAIKFTDVGCIILQVSPRDDYLYFRVRDTGIGIPQKEVTQLFDPFVQVGTSLQRNFQGTGLGLAICEKLINMMDGDIAVESEPGIGSQFTIRIPMYSAKFSPLQENESLKNKGCWLAVRNASLLDYLSSSLGKMGVRFQTYQGETPERDDVLITDEESEAAWQGKAVISFSRQHIGAPLEISTGRWVKSVSAPHELVMLLNKIYTSEPELVASTNDQEPSNDSVERNDDMTILVVDDHPINRRLLADQLASLGYQCKTASDGVEALNVLNRHHIDIVLSDVNMPKMDGYQLTQSIRERGMTLPVIGVTANALAEEKQRCLEAGMDSCLAKPMTLEVIKQMLSLYSERVRQSRS